MRHSSFSDGNDGTVEPKPFNYAQFKSFTEGKQKLTEQLYRIRGRKRRSIKRAKAESIIDTLVGLAEQSITEAANKNLVKQLLAIRTIVQAEFKDELTDLRSLLAQIEVVRRYVVMHRDDRKLDKFASALKNASKEAGRGLFNLVSNSFNDPVLNTVLPLLEKGYNKLSDYRDKKKQYAAEVRSTQESFAKRVLGKDKKRSKDPFGDDSFDSDSFDDDLFGEKDYTESVKSRRKSKPTEEKKETAEPKIKVRKKKSSEESETIKDDSNQNYQQSSENSAKLITILDSHGLLLKNIDVNTKATVDHLKALVNLKVTEDKQTEAGDYQDIENEREASQPVKRYRDKRGRFISKAKWEELQQEGDAEGTSGTPKDESIFGMLKKYLPSGVLSAVGGVAVLKTAITDGLVISGKLLKVVTGAASSLEVIAGAAAKLGIGVAVGASLYANREDAEKLHTDRATALASSVADKVTFGLIGKEAIANQLGDGTGSVSDKIFTVLVKPIDNLIDWIKGTKEETDKSLTKSLSEKIIASENSIKEINESIAESQRQLTGDLKKDAEAQQLINYKLDRVAQELQNLLELKKQLTPADEMAYKILSENNTSQKNNEKITSKATDAPKVTGGIDFAKDDQLAGDFGVVARTEESGTGGAGIVSPGVGDYGGQSYGLYQLASNLGNVDRFLDKSGYRSQFGDMQVNSPEFISKWKELGKDKAFADAQHRYAMEEYYNPTMQALKDSGIDLSDRSRGVKEEVLASSNHLGQGLAVSKFKKVYRPDMTDEELIDAVTKQKQADVEKDFSGSSPETRRRVYNRFEREGANSKSLVGKNPTAADKSNMLDSNEKVLAQKEKMTEKGKFANMFNTQSSVNTNVNNNFIVPNVRNNENSFNRVNECSFDSE